MHQSEYDKVQKVTVFGRSKLCKNQFLLNQEKKKLENNIFWPIQIKEKLKNNNAFEPKIAKSEFLANSKKS